MDLKGFLIYMLTLLTHSPLLHQAQEGSPLLCGLKIQNQKGRWCKQWTYVGNLLQGSLIVNKSRQVAAFRVFFFVQTLFYKHQPLWGDTHQQLRECENVCLKEAGPPPGTGKECPSFHLLPPWRQGKDARDSGYRQQQNFLFNLHFRLNQASASPCVIWKFNTVTPPWNTELNGLIPQIHEVPDMKKERVGSSFLVMADELS